MHLSLTYRDNGNHYQSVLHPQNREYLVPFKKISELFFQISAKL